MEQDNKKKMTCTSFHSMRDLADYANQQGIQREDIVAVHPSDNGIFFLYYK